ncbi:MAG: PleD family two-component system response regulator [Endomicrobiia bacterium]
MKDKPKILVVEDETDVVEILKMALIQSGYEVDCAYDGEEALEKVKSFKPDLILLDLMLPKIDGGSVNLKLKENPETAHIPVIVITGKGNLKELLHLDEGITIAGYYEKPIKVKFLLEKIKTFFEK